MSWYDLHVEFKCIFVLLYFCLNETAKIITCGIVNAGVIHALIMSFLGLSLMLLWFDKINRHLIVSCQMNNKNDQNTDTFIMWMENYFNRCKKCNHSKCLIGHSVCMTGYLHNLVMLINYSMRTCMFVIVHCYCFYYRR